MSNELAIAFPALLFLGGGILFFLKQDVQSSFYALGIVQMSLVLFSSVIFIGDLRLNGLFVYSLVLLQIFLILLGFLALFFVTQKKSKVKNIFREDRC